MITEKMNELYQGSIKNKEFISDAYLADGDKPPKLWSSEIDKLGYATIYYGWLVGKFGTNWRLHI